MIDEQQQQQQQQPTRRRRRDRLGRGLPVATVILVATGAAACSSSNTSTGGTTSSTAAGATSSASAKATGTTRAGGTARTGANGVPRPDHIVVVVEENKAASSIIGSPDAPYMTSLAQQGANFTQSFAITHPSQPNYFVLFSGSTQGVKGDECPPDGSPFATPNLSTALDGVGVHFTGYSEGLPSPGSDACSAGGYQRKHNPWSSFSNVPPSPNQPFTAFPRDDYANLPEVSFVVPDQANDMHDGTVAEGDTWLKDNLDGYVQWAQTHNSLLLVTFDEDDYTKDNRIATFMVGPMVKQGSYDQKITHNNVLRTLTDAYGAAAPGDAANAQPITGAWK